MIVYSLKSAKPCRLANLLACSLSSASIEAQADLLATTGAEP
jgi:hypothetical protein